MHRSDGFPATTLRAMLAAAARSADWDHEVIHRCAWCSRVADADNVYRPARTPRSIGAVTDGICPDCRVDAVRRLDDRRRRRMAAPAA